MTELLSFLKIQWPDGLSMLSGLLLVASFARPQWPRLLLGWLLVSGLVLMACTLGLVPLDLAAYGYAGAGWQALIFPALWVGITVSIAAAGNLWLGLLLLLPAIFWRLGWSPASELLENYLDLPLTLACLILLIRPFLRRPFQKKR
jgi:hypothetical protein